MSTFGFDSELLLVLKTHFAEYKSKPLLNLGFILSLAIATSTLLCITMLNQASKQQYQQANSQLRNPVAFYIVAKQNETLSKADFFLLRKSGFSQISPVLSFKKQLSNGKELSFHAMDLLALSLSMPKKFNAKHVLMTEELLKQLSVYELASSEQQLKLADGRLFDVNITSAKQWNSVALLDLVLAWRLFPEQQTFSYFMVPPLDQLGKNQLELILPKHLDLIEPWSIEERQGFADALHLNLSALAMLGFVVSLFIAFQAGDQAWRKRSELAARLRLLGVNLSTIKRAMFIESIFLVTLASIIGIGIAVILVSLLLPLLGITLSQLYALKMSGHFSWHWHYLLSAIAISTVAVLLALFKQFKQISTNKVALGAKERISTFAQQKITIITVSLFGLFAIFPSDDWYQIMIKYGLLLLATVTLLPLFLQFLLTSLGHLVHSFRIGFVFKDASKQVARRFLPLAAFYLALTASIAAALMVNSFEKAFVQYIDQQLSSDMFIRFNNEQQKQQISDYLQHNPSIDEYVLYQHAWAKVGQDSVQLSTYQNQRQFNSLFLKSSSQQIDDGCYINEQLALKNKLVIDQSIMITQGKQTFNCQIQGIYYQYGYPGFSITLNQKIAQQQFSGWRETGFGLFVHPTQQLTVQQIIDKLGLAESRVYQPAQVKEMALNIFSQTFVLTQSIAGVLLSIACFGLFLSANSLELARKNDLHILSSLGFDKMELFFHMLMQWFLLACGAVILSWPVAAIIADALVGQVLPASFGWSMPLMFDIAPFAASSLLGILFLIPALSLPLFKLNVRSSL